MTLKFSMKVNLLYGNNGRFVYLYIVNIIQLAYSSMLFGRVTELSIKYPQNIMVIVYSAKAIRGTGYYLMIKKKLYTDDCHCVVFCKLLQNRYPLDSDFFNFVLRKVGP